MDEESSTTQDGWIAAATAALEMKLARQLANLSERLSNPLTSPQRLTDGGCRRKPTGI